MKKESLQEIKFKKLMLKGNEEAEEAAAVVIVGFKDMHTSGSLC